MGKGGSEDRGQGGKGRRCEGRGRTVGRVLRESSEKEGGSRNGKEGREGGA